MDIIWDPAKAKANYARHGIRFSEVEGVFYDPAALTMEDTAASSEQRFVALGSDGLSRVLVVLCIHIVKTLFG